MLVRVAMQKGCHPRSFADFSIGKGSLTGVETLTDIVQGTSSEWIYGQWIQILLAKAHTRERFFGPGLRSIGIHGRSSAVDPVAHQSIW
jgi:hypothetical protein